MDSEDLTGSAELAGETPRVGRSKKLAIAGAAVAALSVGMLVGGALGPGTASAQTATPTPAASTDQGSNDHPAGGARGDCPEKDDAAPSSSGTTSS